MRCSGLRGSFVTVWQIRVVHDLWLMYVVLHMTVKADMSSS